MDFRIRKWRRIVNFDREIVARRDWIGSNIIFTGSGLACLLVLAWAQR